MSQRPDDLERMNFGDLLMEVGLDRSAFEGAIPQRAGSDQITLETPAEVVLERLVRRAGSIGMKGSTGLPTGDDALANLAGRLEALEREAATKDLLEQLRKALESRQPFEPQKPRDVIIVQDMNTADVEADETLEDDLTTPGSDLERLLDNPPILAGKASEDADGRRVPIVVVVLRSKDGTSRPGIELRLVDAASGVLLDHSRTDARGVVVLRFPRRIGEEELAMSGRIELSATQDFAVDIPPGVQHAVSYLTLDELPEIVTDAIGKPVAGDDPFQRLPADFSIPLADAIVRLRGTVPDPILGGAADPADFRSSRTPLIKRMTIPRIGAQRPDGTAPPRYLVRVRQEWLFLGYTLGELAGVDSLDPGSVVTEASRALEGTIEQTSGSLDQVTSQLLSTVASSLSQLSSIDSLVSVASSNETSMSASGFGGIQAGGSFLGGIIGAGAGAILGPIGGAIGGLFGGGSASVGISAEVGVRQGTGVFASALTTTGTDTSLQTNSLLHTARSTVNQTLRNATSMLRNVERLSTHQIGKVSPLLSRVTNLLRWSLYENYAVSTLVEDVVEVRSYQVTKPTGLSSISTNPDQLGRIPLFSDGHIVEYRRFFEPALLDQRLLPQFDVLQRGIEERIAGGTPITVVHFAVDYSGALLPADLRVAIGGAETTLSLHPNQGSIIGSLHIEPTRPGNLTSIDLSLKVKTPEWISNFNATIADYILDKGSVIVHRVRLWYGVSRAAKPDTTKTFDNNELKGTNDDRIKSSSVEVVVLPRDVDPAKNPLFVHVNTNQTYYFGVLAQAALVSPSLRDDSPHLKNFNGEHGLWRLPIVGFEGDRILVMSDPKEGDPDAQRLLEDPGAATIIQLATPGAYSEALQGLLSLEDAAGKIHPALHAPLAPSVPPLGLIDLTGKKLEVVDGEVPDVPSPA